MAETAPPNDQASASPAQGYAGNIAPEEAWRMLEGHPRAHLIDVRTVAEWSYVGLPDLSELGRRPLLIEWQTFPDLAVNPKFEGQVSSAVSDKEAPLLFLCRSGARSASAARAMTSHGYTHCYNVSQGFEGDPDDRGQRGQVSGWKVLGLPWAQS
jgi:rhodanese-related sulfurtransferase